MRNYCLVLIAAYMLAACGSGGAPTSAVVLSGTVAKGIVGGGVVTAYCGLQSANASIGLTSTKEDGSYQLSVSQDCKDPIEIVVSAGVGTRMNDEMQGAIAAPSNFKMRAFIPALDGNPVARHITPFTDMAAELVENSVSPTDALSSDLIKNANSAIVAHVLGGNAALLDAQPVPPAAFNATTTSSDQKNLTILLTGISQASQTMSAGTPGEKIQSVLDQLAKQAKTTVPKVSATDYSVSQAADSSLSSAGNTPLGTIAAGLNALSTTASTSALGPAAAAIVAGASDMQTTVLQASARQLDAAKLTSQESGLLVDRTLTAASMVKKSFATADLPICGASKDYPIKIFFESYDVDLKQGDVFIYGGTDCKSGLQGVFRTAAPDSGIVNISTKKNEITLARIDAKTIRVDIYAVDASGNKKITFSGTSHTSPAFDTSLYAGAYWNGVVCRLEMKGATDIDNVPGIAVARSNGYPSFDTIEATGACPKYGEWTSFTVSRHRALNLLSEQESSPAGRYKHFDFQLTKGSPDNWDYQYLGPNQKSTDLYPTKCKNGGDFEFSYMSHLTQSKDGFTAVGYACFDKKVYYQYVKGTFDLNGYSFATSEFPLCSPSADYPVKVFFDEYDNKNKSGKAYIYGGNDCKAGIDAKYSKVYIPGYTATIATSTQSMDLKDIVTSNTIKYDLYSTDSAGGRTLIKSGTLSTTQSYDTKLYADAHWNGLLCTLRLAGTSYFNSDLPDDPPSFNIIREKGFPDINSKACPMGWEQDYISMHRSADLLTQEDFYTKTYHYSLPQYGPGTWDYQLISTSPNHVPEYPKGCTNNGPTSTSYWTHLTQSKVGFTASGFACDNGQLSYKFVNGKF